MAILTLVFGRDVLGTHEIDHESLIIGRAEDCDVMIDNLAVSRHHVVIERDNGVYTVNDLDSNNGTFLNGQRINGLTTLSFGDEIGIGKHVLVFDTHSKQDQFAGSSALGGAIPDMDAPGRGTMFVEPEQMEKIQEKVVVTRKAHLQVANGWGGKLIPIEKADVILGKSEHCDIVTPGLFVSRRHAILSRLDNGFQLTNLAMLLPARVNGIAIDSALLVDGDEIKIGRNRYTFHSGH